jgi:DNA repair protein RecO (recombination protein O)
MIPHTEAIVLKSFDFRETSRIVTFFTKDYGKIKGIMKGVRKDPKKFGSSVDRFSVNDIIYYHYRRTDIHLISQCDLKDFFFPIREDYKKSLAASYSVELIDVVMPPEEPNGDIYKLILDFLETLQSQKDVDKLVHIFQIKMLGLSGFRPHLDTCVKCRRKVKGKVRFSMKAGGLVCTDCLASEMNFTSGKRFGATGFDPWGSTLVSRGTIETLLHIERSSWLQSLRLGLTKTVRRELKFVLNNFLVYHLERELKSAKFLDD